MKNDIEQAEQIKKLWTKYGTTVLTLIFFALAVFLGVKIWNSKKHQKNIETENDFIGLISSVNELNNTKIDFYATKIQKESPDSSYAAISGLFLAKLEIDKNELEKAVQFLVPVIKLNKGIISEAATLRLARIYLAQDKTNLAIKTLNNSSLFKNKEKNNAYQMILGQCYLKQKNNKLALKHLKLALKYSKNDPNSFSLIKAQISNIPISK